MKSKKFWEVVAVGFMEDIAKKLIVKGAKVAIEKGVEYYKERQAAISKAQGMKDEGATCSVVKSYCA